MQLEAGLHVRRKHRHKPRVNRDDASARKRNAFRLFLALAIASLRFTRDLCSCLYLCLCLSAFTDKLVRSKFCTRKTELVPRDEIYLDFHRVTWPCCEHWPTEVKSGACCRGVVITPMVGGFTRRVVATLRPSTPSSNSQTSIVMNYHQNLVDSGHGLDPRWRAVGLYHEARFRCCGDQTW